MPKQNPVTESQADKQNHPKTKSPSLTPDLMGEPVNMSLLPDSFLAAGADCGGAPTARLNNSRLQTAQRQAIASQIGRVQGNRYLQRALAPIQRRSPDAKAAAAPTHTPSKQLDEKEQQRKAEFLGMGFARDNYIPSTGRGKFDIQYSPNFGQLMVTINIYFDFVNSAPPAGEKNQAVIDSYSWSEVEKTDFQQEFIGRVMARWSARHPIRCTKPGWEDIATTPLIVVWPTAESEAHYHASVVKVGGGVEKFERRSGVDSSDHSHEEGKEAADRPRTATLHSTDNADKQNFRTEDIIQAQRGRMWSVLSGNGVTWIPLAKGQTDVPGPYRQKLQKVAQEMPPLSPGAPPLPIIVTGMATADEPGQLSQRRAESVKTILQGAGIANVAAVGKEGEAGSGVGIDLGELAPNWQNKQNTSEHEFGHMLGNPDEYAREGNNPEAWKKLVEAAQLKVPSMDEWTTSQMSAGSDVLAAHYVTIWEALGAMTSGYIEANEWKIG